VLSDNQQQASTVAVASSLTTGDDPAVLLDQSTTGEAAALTPASTPPSQASVSAHAPLSKVPPLQSSVAASTGLHQPSKQASQQASHQPAQHSQVPAELGRWLALIDQAIQGAKGLQGPALNLARNCVVSDHVDGMLTLSITPNMKMLLTDNAQQRLRQALVGLVLAGAEQPQITQIRFNVADHQACTPAQWRQQQTALALERAHQALQADAFVQAIQDTFAATLIKDTLIPLSTDVAENVETAAVAQTSVPHSMQKPSGESLALTGEALSANIV
jgi:hypothetical protein